MLMVYTAPKSSFLELWPLRIAGLLSIAYGAHLVHTSMASLGIIGTYMGDHFGMIMKEKITSYPFDLYEHPMYVGASFAFFGFALAYDIFRSNIVQCSL